MAAVRGLAAYMPLFEPVTNPVYESNPFSAEPYLALRLVLDPVVALLTPPLLGMPTGGGSPLLRMFLLSISSALFLVSLL